MRPLKIAITLKVYEVKANRTPFYPVAMPFVLVENLNTFHD